MHCFSVLVLFLLCSLYGLYVGGNGSGNSGSGLFNFSVYSTPDGHSNAARLIQSEVLRREIPLPKKQSRSYLSEIRYRLWHCIPHIAWKSRR